MPEQVIDIRVEKNKKKSGKKPATKQKEKSKKKSRPILTKIEWVAPEFKKYKKNRNWFVFPALIALAVFIIAIVSKNFLLAVGTILAATVMYIYAFREPRKIKFKINARGITIDQNLYKFDDLKSFWIFYEPPEIKELSLRSRKTFMPYIRIPLADQSPIIIRKFLLKFLPERRHRESTIDEWMRKGRY